MIYFAQDAGGSHKEHSSWSEMEEEEEEKEQKCQLQLETKALAVHFECYWLNKT